MVRRFATPDELEAYVQGLPDFPRRLSVEWVLMGREGVYSLRYDVAAAPVLERLS